MPRFVVLEHRLPNDPRRIVHWDLMFDQGECLATWALLTEPSAAGPIPAQRLADHRRDYLDYQGPISGDRGTVTRWDAGDYHWTAQSSESISGHLEGIRLQGNFQLNRDAENADRWWFVWM